jgi:hypothetical protein
MDIFIEWLNKNSGVFNLLFSFLVAISTVFYAYLTSKLVRETKRLREVQTEPTLEIFFRSHDASMSLLEFVVKNVGQGSAYDITFDLSSNPEGAGTDELLNDLKKLKVITTGIHLLCPTQEFDSYWTDLRQNFESKLQAPITITTTCKSTAGIIYKREHTIDLSELEGKVKIGSSPLYSIAQSVEKLQKDVERISSGWSKLKVDTYSEEDRQQQRIEMEARFSKDS